MIKRSEFPIPEGVVEVEDEYQLKLAHYELLHLKPRGTILFAGEKREIEFQFFANEDRFEGLFARLEEPLSPHVIRVLDYIEKYPRTEAYIQITLLQFKLVFIATKLEFLHGAKQRTFRMMFPYKFLKTHRRKFIRIPFNDAFPAELTFQTDAGPQTRKVKDLSREGLRIRLHEGDAQIIPPGARLKQAVLKVVGREIPMGLIIVSHYPGNQAGLRILAVSDENQVWLRDFIRVLMKQILNLKDPPFDDQIEKDEPADGTKPKE